VETRKLTPRQTGKDEFDASEKEDLDGAEGSKDVGSVFLGLRADLEGNNSSRVYIVSSSFLHRDSVFIELSLGTCHRSDDWYLWPHERTVYSNSGTRINRLSVSLRSFHRNFVLILSK
jgi:hypothetical protein